MNNEKFIKKWKKIKLKGKVRYIISNGIMFGLSCFVGGTIGMLTKDKLS